MQSHQLLVLLASAAILSSSSLAQVRHHHARADAYGGSCIGQDLQDQVGGPATPAVLARNTCNSGNGSSICDAGAGGANFSLRAFASGLASGSSSPAQDISAVSEATVIIDTEVLMSSPQAQIGEMIELDVELEVAGSLATTLLCGSNWGVSCHLEWSGGGGLNQVLLYKTESRDGIQGNFVEGGGFPSGITTQIGTLRGPAGSLVPLQGRLLVSGHAGAFGLCSGQGYSASFGSTSRWKGIVAARNLTTGQSLNTGSVTLLDSTGADWAHPPASCAADFNNSGSVSVQDIFDFLAGYFGQSLFADINHSGTLSVQDIFDFLAAYFTGCS